MPKARSGPSKAAKSRPAMGRRSLTCTAERKRADFAKLAALSSVVSTRAAAPSVTSEQSVRRNGGAISGFLSLTWLQASNENAFCMCASGLRMAFS